LRDGECLLQRGRTFQTGLRHRLSKCPHPRLPASALPVSTVDNLIGHIVRCLTAAAKSSTVLQESRLSAADRQRRCEFRRALRPSSAREAAPRCGAIGLTPPRFAPFLRRNLGAPGRFGSWSMNFRHFCCW
jgi:hypothetical protein